MINGETLHWSINSQGSDYVNLDVKPDKNGIVYAIHIDADATVLRYAISDSILENIGSYCLSDASD